MEWKSTAEVGNPKKRGVYLVWQPEHEGFTGIMVEARYATLTWTGKKWLSSFPVSHWTKLPEPPK